ncbi:MFS general substrate transporter [Mytilinidion resinicola]|uniref:Autophagy-related protein n=1 Tax=Mytilinidion resinicola TaxID=574789 RepID=A0A6A6ZCG3_9PEZI|nr:MFS general substrate transporter [Mytilinidion resinicola]KAF2817995.1 MFS general substrate transporter [Mytilinidion resinicola]
MSFSEDARPLRPARYEGEDTSVTSKVELRGWYTYAVAAEVFAVCGTGSFLPVTMEQLAREGGVLWSDRNSSCVSKASDSNAAGTPSRIAARDSTNQCVVTILGSEVTSSSFVMYTFSIAVLVQAIAMISFSSFADHGPYRKRMLLAFGFTGGVTSMLFLFMTSNTLVLASFLVVIGITCLGSSFTLLNSFLPLLASNHPLVRGRRSSDVALDSLPSNGSRSRSGGRLGGPRRSVSNESSAYSTKKASLELQLSGQISSKGVGIGYIAAVFVQCLSIGLLFGLSKTSLAASSTTILLRMVLFLVGAWWVGFTIPTAYWLRSRPGPPLEAAVAGRGVVGRSTFAYVGFAWMSVWRTFREAIRLRQVLLFLIAWFLLSDAVATVSATAILFARTELHMSTVEVAILSITSTSSGILGAFSWPKLSRRFGLQTNHTIIACTILMEIIPLYGLSGYLSFIQKLGVGGFQNSWEIFPLGVIHGFVMGGLSSYCRSFFGLLIPPGREAAFYALYAVTDKGSSAVGPAVVGKIVDSFGTIRPAFVFLAILVLLPSPLIWMIDVEKGRSDAMKSSRVNKSQSGDYSGLQSDVDEWELSDVDSKDEDDDDTYEGESQEAARLMKRS